MTAIYTAEAIATGAGRNGRARTDDGLLDIQLAAPHALGGSGGGHNPEQLFAAGYAACFHSALHFVARTLKTDLGDSSVAAKVGLVREGNAFGLEVDLEVVIPTMTQSEAKSLAEEAHQVCPYSNAIRGNIEVNITVPDD
ncbi:organic hydroperoxide resistance protein [Arthrobacter sp. D1-29]